LHIYQNPVADGVWLYYNREYSLRAKNPTILSFPSRSSRRAGGIQDLLNKTCLEVFTLDSLFRGNDSKGRG